MLAINELRPLSKSDDKGKAMVRVSNGALSKLGNREDWVTVAYNGKKVYRQVYGAGGIKGLGLHTAEIDYNGYAALMNGNRSHSGKIRISRCNPLIAQFHHPDKKYKWGLVLSAISAIGAIAAIASLYQVYAK